MSRAPAHEPVDALTDYVPGYWPDETSGVLRPVVEAYLRGDVLTPEQVAVMRSYLRQWIAAPGFKGPEVDALRAQVDELRSHHAVRGWLARAFEAGVDPL